MSHCAPYKHHSVRWQTENRIIIFSNQIRVCQIHFTLGYKVKWVVNSVSVVSFGCYTLFVLNYVSLPPLPDPTGALVPAPHNLKIKVSVRADIYRVNSIVAESIPHSSWDFCFHLILVSPQYVSLLNCTLFISGSKLHLSGTLSLWDGVLLLKESLAVMWKTH